MVVATIAFLGMGVDKADVRTVVHLWGPTGGGVLPEIGRAGRDGKPSLALMLCSFADRRTHEFFFERDYPDASELERVYEQLGQTPIPRIALARMLKLEEPALNAMPGTTVIHQRRADRCRDHITGYAGAPLRC